ncbi:MAG: hypothetical protein ACTSX6_13845, partial [Candidatus Heimdallarchaeaceae archaeon]
MKEKIRRLFRKDKKKGKYITESPDWIAFGYWILVYSLGIYFMLTIVTNKQIAAPFLLMIPAIIGVFYIFFILPIKALNFFITEAVLRIILFHIPKNKAAETAVIIGKNEYYRPSFWFAPNYDTDLLLIVKYLKLLGKPFSIYYDVSVKMIDKIMNNKKIKTVFFVGHGRRHGFAVDRNTVLDYCRYNDPKYKKDFIYQIHCNHGKGKSLVEYVVPKENWKECLPEHGYMSNITVNQMFIDKIIALKN